MSTTSSSSLESLCLPTRTAPSELCILVNSMTESWHERFVWTLVCSSEHIPWLWHETEINWLGRKKLSIISTSSTVPGESWQISLIPREQLQKMFSLTFLLHALLLLRLLRCWKDAQGHIFYFVESVAPRLNKSPVFYCSPQLSLDRVRSLI